MGRDRRILHAAVAGAACFVVGLVLAGVTVANGVPPFLAIGVAVLGMLLVGAAVERRRRAGDAGEDGPSSGDPA